MTANAAAKILVATKQNTKKARAPERGEAGWKGWKGRESLVEGQRVFFEKSERVRVDRAQ